VTTSNKPLLIVGAGEFGEIAYQYFTHDSPYEVVAFAAEARFCERDQACGLPLVAFESLSELYPAGTCSVFIAITHTQLNRVRARLYRAVKERGYDIASYVSSHAFVWHNAVVGENCFVFENNVIQHLAQIGNNVVLWSGNHIGHRSIVRDHCFLSSQVVVSGYCDIGESSFLGVNSTIGDSVSVGRDCVIGAGAVVLKNAEEGRIYRGNPAVAAAVGSLRAFRVAEGAK
jgi:sugar O-acyltransferase (sialic acid O-acetyltransferase NeuD family)